MDQGASCRSPAHAVRYDALLNIAAHRQRSRAAGQRAAHLSVARWLKAPRQLLAPERKGRCSSARRDGGLRAAARLRRPRTPWARAPHEPPSVRGRPARSIAYARPRRAPCGAAYGAATARAPCGACRRACIVRASSAQSGCRSIDRAQLLLRPAGRTTGRSRGEVWAAPTLARAPMPFRCLALLSTSVPFSGYTCTIWFARCDVEF